MLMVLLYRSYKIPFDLTTNSLSLPFFRLFSSEDAKSTALTFDVSPLGLDSHSASPALL